LFVDTGLENKPLNNQLVLLLLNITVGAMTTFGVTCDNAALLLRILVDFGDVSLLVAFLTGYKGVVLWRAIKHDVMRLASNMPSIVDVLDDFITRCTVMSEYVLLFSFLFVCFASFLH